NGDLITADPTIAGRIVRLSSVSPILSLSAGLDDQTVEQYTEILDLLQENPNDINLDFRLTPEIMNVISGGALADGPHTLHVVGSDTSGILLSTSLTFTVDRTSPSIT